MKRILQAFLCAMVLLVCSITAQATTITIQSQQVPDFRATGSNLTLRIFLNDRGFITSDGIPLQPGSPANNRWYKQVNCSLVGSTLTIASFTIDSTTDGLDINTATYSAYFYSGNTQLQAYSGFDRFRVPNVIASSSGCTPSGMCATWADIRAFNFTRVTVLDNSTYIKSEIDAKVANASGAAPTSPFIIRTAVPALTGAQVLGTLATGILKNTTTTGVLSIAVANTDYLTPSGNGSLLTNLNATNLASGTIPDSRFPSVLPALSGANLTNLNAGNLTLGILPAGRFPSLAGDVTTVAGALITTITNDVVTFAKFQNINTARLLGRGTASSGDPEEIGVATGTSGTNFNVAFSAGTLTFNIPDASISNRGLITNGTQTIEGAKTFPTVAQFGGGTNYTAPEQAGQGATATGLQVAMGSTGIPSAVNTPVISFQKQSSVDISSSSSEIPFLFNVTKKSGNGNLYALFSSIRQESSTLNDSASVTANNYVDPALYPGQPTATPSTSGGSMAAGTYYYKVSAVLSGSNETIPSWEQSATIGSGSTGSVSLSWSAVSGAVSYIVYRGTTSEAQDFRVKTVTAPTTSYVDTGTTEASVTPRAQTNWGVWVRLERTGAARLSGMEIGVSNTTPFSASRLPTSTNATFGLNIVGSGNALTTTAREHTAAIIIQAGFPLGKFYNGLYFSPNTIVDQAINFQPLGASVPATLHANNQYDTWYTTAGVAKRFATLNASNVWEFDIDQQTAAFNSDLVVASAQTNKITLKSLNIAGTFYPGIWFGSAAPSASNYSFLSDSGTTILNGASAIDFRIGNAAGWQVTLNRHFVPLVDNSFDLGIAGTNRVRSGYFGTSVNAPTLSATSSITNTLDNPTTSAVDPLLTLTHTSTGAPANGLGSSILFQLESTTSIRDAGVISTLWTDVTDATRKSAITFQTTVSGTLTEVMRLDYTNGNSFNASGTAAIFTRTIGASSGLVNSAAQFGLTGFNSAPGDGASMLFFAPDNGGVKGFLGRLSGVVETSSGGAVSGTGILTGAMVVNVRATTADTTALTEAGRFSPTEGLRLSAEFPITLNESSNTPGNPASGTQARIYLKGDKLIVQFNDAGTVRYKFLDLTSTGVTWAHQTSAP